MGNSLPIDLVFQLQHIAIPHADSSVLVNQLLVDNIVMLIGTDQQSLAFEMPTQPMGSGWPY